MDFTNDERFDGLYLQVAQTTRGIDPLLDTVFSFLRRKTDFFHGPNGENTDAAVEKVNQVLKKHVDIYRKEEERKQAFKLKKEEDNKKKKAKEAAAAAAAAQKVEKVEEDVIEMGSDGFDISDENASISKSANDSSKQSVAAEGKAKEDKSIKDEPMEDITTSNQDQTNNKKEDQESADKEKDGLEPSIGNGGTVEGKYVWTQTLSELNLTIPLPDNTRGRDLNVEIKKSKLRAGLKSQPTAPIINAALTHSIICDDSFWTIEDGNRLVINLQKLNQMEWWDAVCEGDPKIDVKKVQPESSRLDDLDGETRQTVEKMMFDQRQKAMGLPSSDEQRKLDALEKFKKAHPEMDFSNAKIS